MVRSHFRCSTLAACAALLLLAPAVRSQLQVFGGDETDRRASSIVMFGEGVMGGVSISYSAPQWKASYDEEGALDKFKGQNVRLGKNWWTTLETSVPLAIGGTKLQPGAYVLGLHYGDEGDFHLVAIDAGAAMKASMMPFAPEGWTGGTKMPLEMRKGSLDKSRERMEISISADKDDPSKGTFSIRWGTHELRADVALDLPE